MIESLKRLGIFLTAAIVADVLAVNLFNLPYEAVVAVTKMSLYLALGVFSLAKTFGGAWLTIGKSIALAAGLSVCIFGLIIYMVAPAAK